MQLISYVSQVFANATALYNYIRDNVPWWDSTADDKLVKDNIEITLSSNIITITETSGGQSKSTSAISANSNAIVLITDDTLGIDVRAGSNTHNSFIIGKATDGTNEHYGAVFFASNATNCLCYGDVTVPNKSYTPTTSNANVQFIPVYSWTTAYYMENAYALYISPNISYLGKLTLNDKKYVQIAGLALEYTE